MLQLIVLRIKNFILGLIQEFNGMAEAAVDLGFAYFGAALLGAAETGKVNWDPNRTLTTGDNKELSATTLLEHELGHAKQHKDGDLQNDDIKCAKEKGTTIYNYNIKNK